MWRGKSYSRVYQFIKVIELKENENYAADIQYLYIVK